MECRGSAHELPIRLAESFLIMEPTYLQLFSQKTVQLVNDSDIVTRFSWRLLPTASEERKARSIPLPNRSFPYPLFHAFKPFLEGGRGC